jgi:hypothetical protein
VGGTKGHTDKTRFSRNRLSLGLKRVRQGSVSTERLIR